MKCTILKTVFVFSMIFMVISCSKTEAFRDEREHYMFENEDLDKLLSYELNQIITYRNQEGDEKKYQLTFITEDYKTSHTVGGTFSGGLASVKYYYDQKEIHLIDINSTNCPVIQLKKWPIFHQSQNGFVFAGAKLFGRVMDFQLWNGSQDVYIDFEGVEKEMFVNGITYNNVLTIESNVHTIVGTVRNVHKIYYDTKNGIIGFDDLDGKEWRLVS